MNSKSLAILLLLFVSILAETDITLTNCPAQYSIATANQTYGSIQLQNFVYMAFNSQSAKEQVQNIVITGNMNQKDQYLRSLAYPYIPFLILSAVIYITLIICCLFDRSCPPCQSWRRDFIQDPYTKKQLRAAFIPTMIFPIVIVGLTVYIFFILPNLKIEMDYTKCSIFNMLDTALNGDTANNWGGYIQLRNKIGNISSLLNSASTQIGTYLPGDDWLVDDMTIMKKTNLDIYKDYKDARLITPDPTATEGVVPGDPLPNIDSIFIKTGMGPNGTINTMVDDIDKGLRTTQILSQQAYSIDLSAKQLVQSSATIQSNTVSAINTLQMYANQLNNSISYMDVFAAEMFDNNFSLMLYLLEATLGFILASSFLIIVGALSVYCFQLLQCRNIVHLGWAIYGIVHFLVIVLIYLFLSGGSVGYHACNYINTMMTQQSAFLRLGDYDSNNILNRMQSCFFSNGDVLQSFAVSKQMETVTDFFANIVTYYDYQNSISKNYIDTSISTVKISGWIAAIEKYRSGIFIDSKSSQTADTNPNYALSRLNLYSLGGGSYPTCSKDRWVFDSTNCTDSSQLLYTPTASDNDGLILSTSQITCISFNQKLSTIQPLIWSQSDFRRRYTQIRQDCNDAYKQIIRYGQSIINFRDSRINLFQGIKDSLTNLLNQNNNFNTLLVNFRSRIDQLYSSVSNLNNLITNEVDGLLVTSDCTILRDDLKVVYNVFCVNFMSNIASMALCFLAIGLLMVGGLCSATILGIKISGYQRDKRIGVAQEESQLNSAEFVKHKQQNNSSQENSQDEKQ